MNPTEKEIRRKIMVIDSKSFYASCECLALGLNPLKAMLVVMSTADNAGSGLVLASSPMAKRLLGISNVTRKRDVPNDTRLIIVQPRMNYYIQMNKKINDVFREFVADEDLNMYSIDETILDFTSSWKYLTSKYGADITMSKLARIIQLEVRHRLGFYLTVGIGDNPAMAKMALDITAKHNHSLIGEWHFEELPDVLWPITKFEDVWSIGQKTAEKLNAMNIHSMYDLAHTSPYVLKEKFGVRGEELFALAWGVDRSIVSHKYSPKDSSISNSQVLPHDYNKIPEIKNVIREIGEQVAARLRAKHKITSVVALGIGSSMTESKPGFHLQMKIDGTNQSSKIVNALWTLFDRHYEGQIIRHISVSVSKLTDDIGSQLDLFIPVEHDIKQQNLDEVVDSLRHKYGTTAIVKSSSKIDGGTMIDRAGLVAGHRGGQAYGTNT
ncbi:Y-family DNA polymerase [Weissella tructae]|uniref:DNA-directed DNA polymerase n=2 Tax=Weissella TaxID=46255 RepID=A0ABM5QRC0_9LACO|nr:MULTISPECIES: Y-family DNA polymerase [Weissella]AIG65474.1 putative DNA-directed DNA polymerase [Weissella tructae]AIM62788.1 putative DNA-directed DNA polymerase [Weissella ceti]AIM64123.1 putative DNA-directed DNA polymerase [Weissella ceti]ELA07066.1 DNA-repair protein (SOS response UmuC-like protein) [Weissella ceti NC36]QVV91848.1 Y-family DNA polymerase [Weissella tructae]